MVKPYRIHMQTCNSQVMIYINKYKHAHTIYILLYILLFIYGNQGYIYIVIK